MPMILFLPSLLVLLLDQALLQVAPILTAQAFPMQVNIDSSVLRSIQVPNTPSSSFSSSSSNPSSQLIGAIDQGTSSTRFLVFTPRGQIAASAQLELRQIYDPEHEGWHEHSPEELWENTLACMNAVGDAFRTEGLLAGHDPLPPPRLAAIGITNQRETTLAWNRATGEPYHNAIVWDDTRTHDVVKSILSSSSDSESFFRSKTGLPIATYFAGSKVKWLLDHVPSLREDVRDPEKRREVCFGTVDSWLLWKLTRGRTFATDVSNASRWLFMDLKTCRFEKELVDRICSPHDVPLECLPEIRPSSGAFGSVDSTCGLKSNDELFRDVPLSGVLGDQQAALFGQTAFHPGEAKNTYGTGLFLMMNTGTQPVPSAHGLLTTVAYRLGRDGDVVYALEGSVSHSGSTLRWLRDQLGLISSAADSETYASETSHNQGLYLVPAFSGLFSPHWNDRARACIVGMTAGHHRGHICRAALEAACYQTREIFDAISMDSGVELRALNVDGGGTVNRFMMQFQADMLGVEVVRPVVMETTALGAAFVAGLAVGVWRDLDEIEGLWAAEERFVPRMEEGERERNWRGWKRAVERSLDWVEDD
mmetsp:Transcript_25708/g.53744  ORF Transcript_25708/g.53744 Transcript_25708/m.53744 type:complete len:592 (+) Transcript_25708:72-1847(+)